MHDRRIGYEEDLPAMLAGPHAEVEVLAVEEVALVHEAEVVHSLASEEHAGSGDRLDGDRRLGERLAMKMKVIEELRPAFR